MVGAGFASEAPCIVSAACSLCMMGLSVSEASQEFFIIIPYHLYGIVISLCLLRLDEIYGNFVAVVESQIKLSDHIISERVIHIYLVIN